MAGNSRSGPRGTVKSSVRRTCIGRRSTQLSRRIDEPPHGGGESGTLRRAGRFNARPERGDEGIDLSPEGPPAQAFGLGEPDEGHRIAEPHRFGVDLPVTEDLEELALLDGLGVTQHIEPAESAPRPGAAHDHSNSIAVPPAPALPLRVQNPRS